MDNLKLYASTDMLENKLNTVKEFTIDIIQKFGLDKSATEPIEKEKIKKIECIDLQKYISRVQKDGAKLKVSWCKGDRPDRTCKNGEAA